MRNLKRKGVLPVKDVLKGLGEYFRPSFVLALVLVIAACFLWCTEGRIPETLQTIVSIVVAFYFGEGTGRLLERNGHRQGP